MTFQPAPVRKKAIVNDIVEQVLDGVREGTLNPGNKLPTEKELAEQFSVGRPVIREALSSLSSLGIIEIRHGLGSYVSENVYSSYLYATAFAEDWKTNVLLELIEVRIVIEPILAELAATRATEKDIEEINLVLSRQEARHDLETTDGRLAFHREDLNFHLAVARAAENKMFFKMMMAVADTLLESRKMSGRLEGAYTKALAYHGRIRDAITQRQPGEAKTAMLEHLKDVEADLRSVCEK